VIYLDTHIVARLYQAEREIVSPAARRAIDGDSDVRISQLVLVELEYLHEIKRINQPALRVLDVMAGELGVHVCDAPFPLVAQAALTERWTRDPFDRIIVAQARLNRARLITLDRAILEHYSRALA